MVSFRLREEAHTIHARTNFRKFVTKIVFPDIRRFFRGRRILYSPNFQIAGSVFDQKNGKKGGRNQQAGGFFRFFEQRRAWCGMRVWVRGPLLVQQKRR